MKKISAGLVASLLLVLPGVTAASGYYDAYGGYGGGYGYGNSGYYNYPTYNSYPTQAMYYSMSNPPMVEYGCGDSFQFTPCQAMYQPQPSYYPTYNYPQYQYPAQQYYNPYVYNANTNTNVNNNVNTINIGNYPMSYGYAW